MPVEAPTNAQSLRVIGQQLADFFIDSFEVEKNRDEYFIWLHRGEGNGTSRAKAFLNSLSQNIRQSPDTTDQNPTPMRLQHAQILHADNENRLRRLQPTEMPDPHRLSTLLRVLGDYLDRKGADEFAIVYDRAALTVRYGQKSESLRVDDLYDLGVHMYLRRSNRSRPR